MSGAFQASSRGPAAAAAAPGAQSARSHIHQGPGRGQRGAAAARVEDSPHRPAVSPAHMRPAHMSPAHMYTTGVHLHQDWFKQYSVKSKIYVDINQDSDKAGNVVMTKHRMPFKQRWFRITQFSDHTFSVSVCWNNIHHTDRRQHVTLHFIFRCQELGYLNTSCWFSSSSKSSCASFKRSPIPV